MKSPKNLGWHHDGIPVAADIFCNFHHSPALIFLEVQKEGLPVRENLFRMQ